MKATVSSSWNPWQHVHPGCLHYTTYSTPGGYQYTFWDMTLLLKFHAAILAEFHEGKFVVNRTRNWFAAEQHYCQRFSQGRASELMTIPGALRQWLVAGPEVARMVTESEVLQGHSKISDHHHHEQLPGVQVAFLQKVTFLVAVIEKMGSPFMEKVGIFWFLSKGIS